MTKPVVLSDDAISDIDGIYDWIADNADTTVAQAYIERLKVHCLSFATFPERGTLRPDLRSGLRTIGFRRQVTIVFAMRKNDVLILRIARRGRDIGTMLAAEEED